MSKKNKNQKQEPEKMTQNENINIEQNSDIKNENIETEKSEKNFENTTENTQPEQEQKVNDKSGNDFEEKYNLLNDKYLRLSAEFDNYRKRTLKERMELIKSAGEDILVNFITVLDNMQRAQKSASQTSDIEAVKQGIDLIIKSLTDFLTLRGIKEIEAEGQNFDTDLHEALTKIPAPEEDLKGKVVDVIEKGYKLNDKVIRYAKVVVGE